MKKRVEPRAGDVFELPLGDGKLGFGHVLSALYLGFYALQSDQRLSVEEIVRADVAFRLNVTLDALEQGVWPILANAPFPPAMAAPLRTWHAAVGGPPFLREWAPGREQVSRPASREEVRGVQKNVIVDSRSMGVRMQRFFRGEPFPAHELG